MEITLYHGSEKIVERPLFGVGRPTTDYGSGFYCTENCELAKEWACSEGNSGFANQYKLSLEGLSVLNLNDAQYNTLNWLAVLLENRTFGLRVPLSLEARDFILSRYLPDYKSADVMIGYRVDDSYFTFCRLFLRNSITLEQLQRAMLLGRLGDQVVLKSRRAFNQIVFEQALPADENIYYPLYVARDQNAQKDFLKIINKDSPLDGYYMIDIIRQNWKNDDPRLF